VSGQPRPGRWDWLGAAVLVALMACAGLRVSAAPAAADDRPPCETGSGGECGCDPVHGPCSMPCSGCCPGGCKAAPPLPGAR
jgi:hypothetical protein